MIELKKEKERVILVGLDLPGQADAGDSLDELNYMHKLK